MHSNLKAGTWARQVFNEQVYTALVVDRTALEFEVLPFRFHFTAREPIHFPSGKSGNVIRGAFGTIFRKLACAPDCPGANECDRRAQCPYARVFEPASCNNLLPSGLADWPRPFVFRATHLDGHTIRPGESFHFDVHLFDCKEPPLTYFIQAFSELAHEGLGPGRGRATLASVDQVNAAGASAALHDPLRPIVFDLQSDPQPTSRIVVRFVSPTELKSGPARVTRPEFAILFARTRDRISTLRALYGAGPLPIDFRAMGERAAQVRLTRCDLRHTAVVRRSGRTGQEHPLGGFLGEVEYEGELAEFTPYLRAARWTGVGRQTVWGNGEVHVSIRS